MASENRFAQFVADLVLDPKRIKQYLANPGKVMDDAGLDAEEQAVMESNKIDVMLDYARTSSRPGGSEGAGGAGAGGTGGGG